jgi:ADP-heptose:LPS heptosyltransferase
MLPLAHRFRRALASPWSNHSWCLQRLWWPNPLRAPYLARELYLERPGELGDVLMCLAVIAEIRRRNPAIRLTFITRYHELLRDHPLLDQVLPPEEAASLPRRRRVALRYEVFIPPRRHLIDYLGACVGLREVPREIPLPDYGESLGELRTWLDTPRPVVAVVRKAGNFTPNKNWPDSRWRELITRLGRSCTVLELGQGEASPPLAPHHHDLRGRTTLRQYCALIARARLVVSPVTSAVHVAAAYGVPVISITGGYEDPANTAYPRHRPLHRRPRCSPCWLTTPCPYDLACLHDITVEEVMATILSELTDTPSHVGS